MINQIGAYSLYICLFVSVYLILKSYISSKNFDKKIDQTFFATLSVQLFMTILSFFTLVFAFVFSDFSNITVFNNSHTLKPLFYKISLIILKVRAEKIIFATNILLKYLDNSILKKSQLIVLIRV